MYTGGGSLLNGRWRGSTTLTPSRLANHNFPSEDLVTAGLKPAPIPALRTPSEMSKTEAWIACFVSLPLSAAAAQPSNSERLIRTRPQAMFSQNEPPLSRITQFTASQ